MESRTPENEMDFNYYGESTSIVSFSHVTICINKDFIIYVYLCENTNTIKAG